MTENREATIRTVDNVTRHRAVWVYGVQGRQLNLGDLRKLLAATEEFPDDAQVTGGTLSPKEFDRLNVSCDIKIED
jgi:hypothetical protein